jgi:AmiR/NasT family two-component response regulator
MTAGPTFDGTAEASAREALAALERENAQLRTALETRIVIEQAKGAVSAHTGVAPDVAFELMRGLARSQRRSIHEFAAEIVANGGRLGGEA